MTSQEIDRIASKFFNSAEQFRTGGEEKHPEYIRFGKALGGLYKALKLEPHEDHLRCLQQGQHYIIANVEDALMAGITVEQLQAAFTLAFGRRAEL